MDYERVVLTLGVVVIGIIGYFALIGSWNASYGDDVGSSANATYTSIQTLAEAGLFNLSIATGNATESVGGAGATSTNAELVQRGLRILTSLPRMIGLVPAMAKDFALILQIPDPYIDIAGWIFVFSFALVFAYLVIIGVRRLL